MMNGVFGTKTMYLPYGWMYRYPMSFFTPQLNAGDKKGALSISMTMS